MTAETRPPSPHSLSLAVTPSKVCQTSAPCPAGIISPTVLSRLSPRASLFLSQARYSFLFSCISFSFDDER